MVVKGGLKIGSGATGIVTSLKTTPGYGAGVTGEGKVVSNND